jgi:putative ABC transporter-associated repeat protein
MTAVTGGAAALAAVLFWPATAVLAAPTAPASSPVVLTAGHADLGPRLLDGAWRIQARDDTVRPPAWRSLDDVVVHAVDATRTTVPASPQFSFLGPAGRDVWVLPQVQRPDAVWLGWNTQDPSVATTIRREMTWRVHQVTGPGRFALFLNGNFGAPEVVFDSGKPLPQDSGVEANTHVHGNWVFTAPGAYRIDLEMAATSQSGERLSGRGSLRVFVGAGDPATSFPAAAAASAAATTPGTAAAGHPGTGRPWLWPVLAGAVLTALSLVVIVMRRTRRTGR